MAAGRRAEIAAFPHWRFRDFLPMLWGQQFKTGQNRIMDGIQPQRPTGAFIAAAWLALGVGVLGYLIGLWNVRLSLHEKGYYLVVLMYGLFSAVSLQKTVRDRLEGIPVTGIYYGLCWVSVGVCVLLMAVGLWNAPISGGEQGFYAMSYLFSLFGAITVQKNIRDLAALERHTGLTVPLESKQDVTWSQ
jgi:uncharacterized membrane protein YiaA